MKDGLIVSRLHCATAQQTQKVVSHVHVREGGRRRGVDRREGEMRAHKPACLENTVVLSLKIIIGNDGTRHIYIYIYDFTDVFVKNKKRIYL